MKNISLFVVALLISGTTLAQVATDSTKASTNDSNSTMNNASMDNSSSNDQTKMVDEFYVMRNGKLIKVKNKIKTDQADNVTLGNGTQISSTGQVQFKDGKTQTLKEGEIIDMNGNILSRDHMNARNRNWNNGKAGHDRNMRSMNRSDSSWKNHNYNRNNSWKNRSDSGMMNSGSMNTNRPDSLK